MENKVIIMEERKEGRRDKTLNFVKGFLIITLETQRTTEGFQARERCDRTRIFHYTMMISWSWKQRSKLHVKGYFNQFQQEMMRAWKKGSGKDTAGEGMHVSTEDVKAAARDQSGMESEE